MAQRIRPSKINASVDRNLIASRDTWWSITRMSAIKVSQSGQTTDHLKKAAVAAVTQTKARRPPNPNWNGLARRHSRFGFDDTLAMA